MQQTVEGLILQNTRYQDKKNILKIYTLQHGVQSYFVHIGHSKKSKIRPAQVTPLNQVEFIEYTRLHRDIQTITELHLSYVYQNLSTVSNKNLVAVFLNEVLLKCLKEQSPNPGLYTFITQNFRELDDAETDPVNFHLDFLLGLSKHLGFYPNHNLPGKNLLFDLREGVFTPHIPSHLQYVDEETATLFREFISTKESGEAFMPSGKNRNILLQTLVLFFQSHIPGFGEMKSLPVLREILS